MASSTRPYVDTRIGDLALARAAADRAADHWGLAAPALLRHGMNAIYRTGDTVLRIADPSVPATVSLDLAGRLVELGIPVPRSVRSEVVEHGGLAVTAWEFVESTGRPTDWTAVGEIVRRVHAISPSQLPAGVPLPSPVAFPWWRFDEMLAAVAGHVDEPARVGLEAAIERHGAWERAATTDTVVCHGDVHPGNVLMGADGPVLLDWDLMCRAPIGWDHGPLMTWSERWGGRPGIYDEFAEGYGWSGRGDPATEAFAELRLVAATLMRVRAGIADPAARPEADRRLAHWRGDPSAPAWNAQ